MLFLVPSTEWKTLSITYKAKTPKCDKKVAYQLGTLGPKESQGEGPWVFLLLQVSPTWRW